MKVVEKKVLTPEDIKLGHWYRGKRFKECFGINNDRVVVWIAEDGQKVQYDSDTVPIGRRRPVVTMFAFLKWAKEEAPYADRGCATGN